MAKNKIINIDKKFDDNEEDVLEHFDTNNATRRILVDFPQWMIDSLDNEARYLGISRQAVIKFWINEKLKERALIEKNPAQI